MRLWGANKNVGAHSICARKACAAVYIPGGYGIRPYGCFERSASDAVHHIYYFLFIIFYLQIVTYKSYTPVPQSNAGTKARPR